MSIDNLEIKTDELKELENFMAEINEQAEAIRDTIKEELKQRDTEERECGKYVVRWTSVLSSRIDTKKLKELMGIDFIKKVTKEVYSRRFQIS